MKKSRRGGRPGIGATQGEGIPKAIDNELSIIARRLDLKLCAAGCEELGQDGSDRVKPKLIEPGPSLVDGA